MDPLLYSYLPAHFCVCPGCPTRKNRAGTSEEYEVFCFNPNEDIGTIASSLGWDQAKQEKKWLQVYNTVVAEGQKKNTVKRGTGIVHIVWNGDPPENTDAAWIAAEKDPPGLVCPHSRHFTIRLAHLQGRNTALPGRKCASWRVVRRSTSWIHNGRWNAGL